MTIIDEKVTDYVRRAIAISADFYSRCKVTVPVGYVAKLLQEEDHFQGKKSKRSKKNPDIFFDYETKEWTISDEYVKILQDLYKGKDLKREFEKMTSHLLGGSRKSDFKRFVHNWLSDKFVNWKK